VASQTVWFPPGRWVDWFTGATFDGPSKRTLTVPLDRMPVFVRAGGIVPEQPGTVNVAAAAGKTQTIRVFSGASGQFGLYSDAGTGLGYQHGQYTLTKITSEPGTVTIGPASGHYPGEPGSRAFQLQLVDLSRPSQVSLDGRPLPQVAPGGNDGWWYDAAAQTVNVALPASPADRTQVITQAGGSPVTRGEPAAADLTINPPAPLTLNPGQSAQVMTTIRDAGPGTLDQVSVGLTAPQGWTVTPATAQTVPSVADGTSATQSWTVTAPASAQGPQTASLLATATYTSAGRQQAVTASEQAPPAPAPLPPPVISNVQPASGNAGTSITITGQNFGASQGSSYLTLADLGTSWGAPFDGATLDVTSWSDTSITFVLPSPQGPNGVWHLVSGTTATVTVTVSGATSNAGQIAIT
jgi:hypothetical protein